MHASDEHPGAFPVVLPAMPQQLVAPVVYEPRRGLTGVNFREVWQFRELLYFLTWRDIKVRYRQTVIGAVWAILQPLLTMVVFTVVFGRLIGVPSDGVPYPIFSFAALLPWTFFATALSRSAGSLVYDADLISKVYFPRLIAPAASVTASLPDFVISFVVLVGMMTYYGVPLSAPLLFLPLFVLLAIAVTLGCGLWFSALNVKYRDIGYVIPYLTQVWFFLTPVVYPSSVVPEQWRLLAGLNPMVGVVDGFRWAVLGEMRPAGGVFALSTAVALVGLVTGLMFFRQVEDEFADVV